MIKPDDKVTLTVMNHIIEVQHLEKMNTKIHIKKLDKNRYMVIDTGEIREFEQSETRADNENSLRQTFKKLRYLINNNFIGAPNELFITLTYAEQTRDYNKICTDFNRFNTRLKRYLKGTTTFDYINVIEPHQSGNFHLHLLLRLNDVKRAYIPSHDLARMWEQGYVKIQSLEGVDNIGAYLTAYLTDIEIDPETDTTERADIKEVKGKKYVKGARLHFYPVGLNIFRKSRGIQYPERQITKYKNIKKVAGLTTPHYQTQKTIQIGDFTNTITFEEYNLQRVHSSTKEK